MNASSRRGVTIGASVAAVVVLLAGMGVFVANRGDQSDTTVGSSTTSSSTSIDPTTTTSSTTTSSTVSPVIGVANAGPDLDVDLSSSVSLAALDLVAGTPDESVIWSQTSGPDVTAGTGTLGGPAPTFTAPTEVSTLTFELSVTDVTDTSDGGRVTDEVVVRVFESADQTVFVDGELGADEADGSRLTPYRTLRRAVDAASGRDVYVRSVGIYDTSDATLMIDPTTSIYGGYDGQWLRDVSARANVKSAAIGLSYTDSTEVTLSALDIVSVDAPAGGYAVAVSVDGATALTVVDSRIVAGSGGDGGVGQPGQWSAGMSIVDVDKATINRSTVGGGRAGAGGAGLPPTVGEVVAAQAGADALADVAGAGGQGSGSSPDRNGASGGGGGAGGNGQPGVAVQGSPAAGGISGRRDGGPGSGGRGGDGGPGGSGGVGLVDALDGTIVSTGSPGDDGSTGSSGAGGNGGGGGFGTPAGRGGGGGGGGGGGQGSIGGQGGAGGGASVGVVAFQVDRFLIVESLISGTTAGAGGAGSAAPSAPTPGAGGGRGDAPTCSPGPCSAADPAGSGGGGGAGGSGGGGGQAGGGAGGPSIGLLSSAVDTVDIRSSTLRGGEGGAGAAGGAGGLSGANGSNAAGSTGAPAPDPVGDRPAQQGVGAGGGSSFGWFDDGQSGEIIDDETFESGVPGTGGSGGEPGPPGVARPTNR